MGEANEYSQKCSSLGHVGTKAHWNHLIRNKTWRRRYSERIFWQIRFSFARMRPWLLREDKKRFSTS
jgi:hypothetical protein